MALLYDTNYSQKSLSDLIAHLDSFKVVAKNAVSVLEKECATSTKDYVDREWQDLGILLNNTHGLLKTTQEELSIITKEIPLGVQKNHTERLFVLGKEFSEMNRSFGKVWNVNFLHQDTANQNFWSLQKLYSDTKDAIINLAELIGIAERLQDFIGSSVQDKIVSIETIEFDDTTARLKVNGTVEIPLPPYENEHYLCRSMAKRLKNEAVDWSEIYHEMIGDPLNTQREDRHMRMVKDTCIRINKRISTIMGAKVVFCLWRNKTVAKLY